MKSESPKEIRLSSVCPFPDHGRRPPLPVTDPRLSWLLPSVQVPSVLGPTCNNLRQEQATEISLSAVFKLMYLSMHEVYIHTLTFVVLMFIATHTVE